jgi:uncharacterized protein (TIGR04255 family)
MAYPFPHQEQHKIFKNTFLQNTFAELHFPQITESEWNNGDPIQSFLSKYFHINNAKVTWDNIQNGISLTNKDTDVTLHFSKEFVGVRVGRKNYQSFATSVMPYLYLLKGYVKEVLSRDNVASIDVRKINLWPYSEEGSNNQLGDHEIVHTIISEPLINAVKDVKEVEGGQIKTIEYQERETSLFIGYGVTKNDSGPIVILDTTAKSEQTQPTGLSDVEAKLDELNTFLYDAYHWSVTEKVIQWMEGKEE